MTATRIQSLGEEIGNSLSHGGGVLLAGAVLPLLVVNAATRGDAVAVVGAAVFGSMLVLMYLASTLYHALPGGSAKRVFRVLDHSAIYLLIAGTYTPFTLGALGGAWGFTLFGLVWGLAVAGVVLKAVAGMRFPGLSLGLYLAMGWLAVIAAGPLVTALSASTLAWLLAGGIAYTLGVPFFATDDRLRYGHFVWHLFVIAGSACHVVAVLACTEAA